MSKVAVFTDIHGRLDEFLRVLDKVPTGAQLIFLGDYIDRGSQSAEVVSFIRALPGAICLRGNHEDMLLHDQGMWIANGGASTIASYRDALTGELNHQLLEEHARWMLGLPRVHFDDHRVYVHAGVSEAHSLDQQPESITQWYRYPKGADVGYHGLHVVHGHTPGIFQGQHRTCLDGGKVLTCGVFDGDKPVSLIWA
jgi:serine/threonine protein phosphatase 1